MRRFSFWRLLIYAVLLLVAATMFLPFVRVIAVSFSSRRPVEMMRVNLWPVLPTLDSYQHVLSESRIWQAMTVTVSVTVMGTLLSMIVMSMFAFPLSRREFAASKGLMIFVILTMVFQAPIIPFFLTVKALQLLDSIWALILPLVANGFNLIIMRTFFMETPDALLDSGRIDGCGDLGLLTRIVLPISKPVLATVALFYAVSYWNIFYNALLFIYKKELQPLQIIVRSYVENSVETPGLYLDVNYNNTTLQMATVLVATTPIILVYPFLQKYFVVGVTLGAVKE